VKRGKEAGRHEAGKKTKESSRATALNAEALRKEEEDADRRTGFGEPGLHTSGVCIANIPE
jgi:hypothetical protein